MFRGVRATDGECQNPGHWLVSVQQCLELTSVRADVAVRGHDGNQDIEHGHDFRGSEVLDGDLDVDVRRGVDVEVRRRVQDLDVGLGDIDDGLGVAEVTLVGTVANAESDFDLVCDRCVVLPPGLGDLFDSVPTGPVRAGCSGVAGPRVDGATR